ncbi:MAG: hypothetical protein ACFFE1_03560 [Candidatus Thorarchaeota archaeon]
MVTSPPASLPASFPFVCLPIPGNCSSSSWGNQSAIISAIFSQALGHRFSTSMDFRATSAIEAAASDVRWSIFTLAGRGNPHIARYIATIRFQSGLWLRTLIAESWMESLILLCVSVGYRFKSFESTTKSA